MTAVGDVIVFGTWMPSTPWRAMLPPAELWHYCPDCQVRWTISEPAADSACWNCEKMVRSPWT